MSWWQRVFGGGAEEAGERSMDYLWDPTDPRSLDALRRSGSSGTAAGARPTVSGATRTPEVSGATRTPEVSGATRTPEVSGATRTPEVSGATRTPEVSGATRTPEVSGATRTPEVSGATRTPGRSGAVRAPEAGGAAAPALEELPLRVAPGTRPWFRRRPLVLTTSLLVAGALALAIGAASGAFDSGPSQAEVEAAQESGFADGEVGAEGRTGAEGRGYSV